MNKDGPDVIQRLFDTRRITVSRRALKDIDGDVVRFASVDAIKTRVREQLSRLPEPLLSHWEGHENGFLVVTPKIQNSTAPGAYSRLTCEAQVTTEAVWLDQTALEEEVIHLLDHLLGSDGKVADQTLSMGYSVFPKLQAYASDILALYADEGNHVTGYASRNPREFLAQSVCETIIDVNPLRDLFPQVYTLVTAKFLSEDFWREML